MTTANHLIPKGFNFSPDVQTNPAFLFADGLSFREAEIAKRAAICNRLVKAPKSPTRENNPEAELEYAFTRHQALFKQDVQKHCAPELNPPVEFEHSRSKAPKNAVGCKTVIEFREWQEAWRIRTEVECTSGAMPPPQAGTRESDMLTARAANKIAESCEFMHLKHGGFKTFVTGTLSAEARKKLITTKIVPGDVQMRESDTGDIAACAPFTPITFELETSIQKEVTRTMDALQKMYKRGWQKEDGTQVAGNAEGLPYLWVVEVPENEKGEPNPHIHMLLGWGVEYCDFKEWSARIEKIWGHGYFHLEKIKDASCAGAYMAKAAGYLCKAQGKDDQGTVQGNRYGISKTARAPAWLQISHAQMECMGQLIYDVYDHLTVKYGETYRERKKLNEALGNIPKDKHASRNIIGKRLAKVRKTIKDIPIRCNKYQIVVTGKAAALSLFTWLKTPTSEEFSNNNEPWLPVKPEGWVWQEGPRPKAENNQFFSRIYKQFKEQKFWRRLEAPMWFNFLYSESREAGFIEHGRWVDSVAEEVDEGCVSDWYNLGVCQ